MIPVVPHTLPENKFNICMHNTTQWSVKASLEKSLYLKQSIFSVSIAFKIQ